MTVDDLIIFEQQVAAAFARGEIGGPVHLSGGNEPQLVEIFKGIDRRDYVFSTWRSHFHALLHGVPRDYVMSEILSGRSMNIFSPAHRFFTSAIVGGCLPIAVGVASGIKRRGGTNKVWAFLGDMAASAGAFHETSNYAYHHDLPITFVIEDNGLSTDTPTMECWGINNRDHQWAGSVKSIRYTYQRVYPHYGVARGGNL